MLAAIGFAMVITIIILLLKGKSVPMVIFTAIPVVAALLAGFSPAQVGDFVAKGVASTLAMSTLFIFSITFFGIMQDVGLFEVVVARLVKVAGNNVTAVMIVAALVAMISHLDGSGATTCLITIPAMLPLFLKLNIRRTSLLLITSACLGVMNLVPWGGPTIRAATAIKGDATAIWHQMIPMQGIGLVLIIGMVIILARTEIRKGAGLAEGADAAREESASALAGKNPLARPKLLWFNGLLTAAIILVLCFTKLPTFAVFMLGVAIAMPINFPDLKTQQERVKVYAPSAMLMASTLLAAGVLLGVLSNSGMITEMTKVVVAVVPKVFAPHLHFIIGLFAVPLGMVFGPDPYYYGILPIVNEVSAAYGIPASSVAISMLIGENVGCLMSPVIPTAYLGLGLCGVELKDHIRSSFFWLWGLSVAILIAGALMGSIVM